MKKIKTSPLLPQEFVVELWLGEGGELFSGGKTYWQATARAALEIINYEDEQSKCKKSNVG